MAGERLCRRVCFDDAAGRDRSREITTGTSFERRSTSSLAAGHLDQLADKLQEDRVRRVIEPLLSGGDEWSFQDSDLDYVRDLGLIARDPPPRIANPIYAEVVPRELTSTAQERWSRTPPGTSMPTAGWTSTAALRVPGVLPRALGTLAGPLRLCGGRPALILQAFLQRIVNSGGRIEREYGLGRGRTDLLIVWPREPGAARETDGDRFVIECKVVHGDLGRTIEEGVQQAAAT